MRSQALRLEKIWRLVSSSFFSMIATSSSKLMSREWVSGCFFNSSSLACNSAIGFSKSSWCFIGGKLSDFGPGSNNEESNGPQRPAVGTDKEPDLHPALSGDEVYTPSPRRSEGWRGQLFARCSNR